LPRHQSLIGLLALVVLSGCAPRLIPPGGAAGAAAAPAAVERFLQLASERDYSGMGWIFGTAAGPVIRRDPISEVEQRMYALANLLGHDTFVVGASSPVPGRPVEALGFNVVLRRGQQTFQVPVITVRGPEGRWFVEQLSVESITAR
jgi:hypothetical protein